MERKISGTLEHLSGNKQIYPSGCPGQE